MLRSALKEANIGNDNMLGDDPNRTLAIHRTHSLHELDEHTQEQIERLEGLSGDAPRFSAKALAKKIVGRGKSVSEFQPERSEEAKVIEFPNAPTGDQFELPKDKAA